MPLTAFIALTTLGCGIWAGLFVLIGLASGTAWTGVNSVLGKTVFVGAGIGVAYAVIRRRNRSPGR